MRFTLATSLLPLAVSVSALQVTQPEKGAEIDPSDSFTVKWDSVSTDPSSFDLYLVNNAVYPSVEKKIASDVDTSDGSYTVDSISGLEKAGGYQINLFSNEAHNTGILAQSEQFNVTGSDTTSSSSSTTTPTSTSTSSSTSTSTESETTSTPSTSTETSSSTTTTTTEAESNTASSSAAGSSSTTPASSSDAAATASASDAPDDLNAGVAMGAPITLAGLMAGALMFTL
ncbi:Ser-Thr-rich glycosyl-phosphatidyl-inositol-anchored membrane family-domain-containing protein [Aspergillus multicolor]|uniref:GPI anchored serine-threonine rich family protein n=1 Tax=Aspergillus multicolor TaxID=41759 RepID=UPI003CCD63C5